MTMVAMKCQSRSKVVIDRSSIKFQVFLEATRDDRYLQEGTSYLHGYRIFLSRKRDSTWTHLIVNEDRFVCGNCASACYNPPDGRGATERETTPAVVGFKVWLCVITRVRSSSYTWRCSTLLHRRSSIGRTKISRSADLVTPAFVIPS